MKISAISASFLFVSTVAAPLLATNPVFIPMKVDGPTHAPEKNSWWYGPFSEASAVFDVDGDGDLDITAGNHWYENAGAERAGGKLMVPKWRKHSGHRPHASVHGEFVNNCGEYPLDVNRDGKLDLVSAGWMKDGVWWYENPGGKAGEWRATKIISSQQTEGLVVEDIDGDGDADVLVNHWGPREGQGVTWLELQDDAEFAVHVLGTEGDHHGIGLGDLDGDGRKDVITPNGWYRAPENVREEKWEFRKDYGPLGELGIRMLVVDVNEDGLNDIVYGRGHDYGLYWLVQTKTEGDAEGLSFSRPELIRLDPGQFHTLVLADVNQDGRDDLVTGKRLRGHAGNDPSSFDPLGVFWYEIKDGKFIEHVLSYNHLPFYAGRWEFNPPPLGAIGTGMNINVADLNGDGKVEIVMSGKTGLYVFLNRGVPPTSK